MIETAPQKGIRHKSLVEAIVENIEEKILKGELKPGERLVEQAMCEELGVSRSPLREAFRILENQGFLVNEARKGVSVAKLSLKEAIDIYTIRAKLESLATRLAVESGDKTLPKRLEKLHNDMCTLVKEGDLAGYSKLNAEFHETLISACGNDHLIRMLDLFNKKTLRYRMEVLSTPGKLQESLRKHEKLIESIKSGNASDAERIREESILANIPLIKNMFVQGIKEETH
ncbi:MAG: hypothetical protein PWR02_1940 [Synergistales bacterium]|nr:hypothetical protein [Synergistales bacterium]